MITDTTNYAGLKTAIRDWLLNYSGGLTDVIFSNQAEGRPAKPYATILIIVSGIKLGLDDDVIQTFDVPGQAIQREHLGPRQMTIQIEIYSEPAQALTDREAADYLNQALHATESIPVRDLFRNAGIALARYTAPNRLDEQLGERWERRSQTDLTINYTGSIFDDGGAGSGDWVETVETPLEQNGNLTINE